MCTSEPDETAWFLGIEKDALTPVGEPDSAQLECARSTTDIAATPTADRGPWAFFEPARHFERTLLSSSACLHRCQMGWSFNGSEEWQCKGNVAL